MCIAISEGTLAAAAPGAEADIATLFDRAAALGADGVELDGAGLENRIETVAEAMQRTGVAVAGIDFGRQGALLSPDVNEREAALERLRSNITCAVDLDAAGVVVVPHYGPVSMPDLAPWMAPGELHAEMLHMHLRTLSDFCRALGSRLFIQTAAAAETGFIWRLEQAGAVVKRIKHRDIQIGVDLGCLVDEGGDPAEKLRTLATHLGYVRLPAEAVNRLEMPAVVEVLKSAGNVAWISLRGENAESLHSAADRLRGALSA
ncbi:MAG: sugar phosphate isomerase/epimerase [Chloroflexi bacterium]|nr:sugar phosphate isomerase/epimerase [Chloroflexota bacterium]